MQRRDFFLKGIFNNKTAQAAPPPPSDLGLDPYTGTWDKTHVSQFLRRTIFGPTYAQISEVENVGLAATVQNLLQDTPIPAEPVNYGFETDPYVNIGESWVDAPYVAGETPIKTYRRRSLVSWTFQNINNQGISLMEKMVLFWHNHFVISDIRDPKFVYQYIKTIRSHTFGDFRQFVKDMSIDPSMLRYLNGRDNTESSPNENYARELLELFTIGKGPQIAPGDYTHYSEEDILIIAKILTGWRDVGYNSNVEGVAIDSVFVPNRHDTSTKTLTAHFNNAVIEDGGENEVNTLIDIILEQDEVSRFIVRQIYQWFMFSDVTDTVEQNIIEPLAQIFRDNNYQIKPVLETFLLSEHFHDFENHGALIKSPIDVAMSLFNQFEIELPGNLEDDYDSYRRMGVFTASTGMEYYIPPSVAGWQAFYQSPGYYRSWINSVTLVKTQDFRERMLNNGYNYDGFRLRVDPNKFAQSLSNSSNIDDLISDSILVLLPKPLTDNQVQYIKDLFLDGTTEEAWATTYNIHIADPSSEDHAYVVYIKVRALLQTITRFPEYLLS